MLRLLPLLLPALLVACDPGDSAPLAERSDSAPRGEAVEAGPGAQSPFDAAAAAFDVPVELLVAVASAETGVQMVRGEQEFPGQVVAWGVMGLRDDVLPLGASLAGVSESDARADMGANVAAAAALLDVWAHEAGIDRDDLGAWAPVVARYAHIDNDEAVAGYVHDAVYSKLRQGMVLEGVRFKPLDVEADFPRPAVRRNLGDSGAIWRPSPNYNSRGGSSVDYVIIHTCEGTYSGCWSWLVNSASGVSAHYVVNESGSEVSQLVDENNRGWHIGASYDCANNSGVECWRNGTSMNTVSVGIEHGGYASSTSWPSSMIQRSAELVCGITQRHGIARDGYHIVAHGQLQPYNRTDPGAGWPWSDYLSRIDVACGGTPPNPGVETIIDSNNAANDTNRYLLEVSADWISSTNVSGYYNTGYYAGPSYTGGSDPARFKFNLTADTCYDVYGWWTAATDRATSAPFIFYNAAGAELGRANANQTANGGRWNYLGRGLFTPGWNQVALSRWVSAGTYAIADAVKLVESDQCPVAAPDTDGDGTPDATDGCPTDASKTSPGTCGCGVADTDTDADGFADCVETCDTDPAKTSPGVCGCGIPDEDITGDGIPDCTTCGDGIEEAPETCDDGNRRAGDGCSATCQDEPLNLGAITPGVAGVANTWRSTGGRPGRTISYVAATRLGTTPVPGCPGLTVPLAGAQLVGSAVSDGAGIASRSVVVPSTLAGRTVVTVAVELSSCRVSGTVVEIF